MLETRTSSGSGVETAGDGRVAYAEYGAPDGTPVLALHGTPGSRRLWELFDGEARRAGVRLIAPDRPGYGRSAPQPIQSFTDAAACLEAVLDDAGVESAAVIGFSGGAPHALALAATAPERVRSVHVLAGAVPPAFDAGKPPLLRALDALACRSPRLLRAGLWLQTRALRHAPPSLVASQYTNRETEPREEVAAAVARDFHAAFSRSRRGFVAETRLLADEWGFDPGALEPSVSFSHGERDDNVPVAGVRRFAEGVGKLAVLDGADHLGTLCRGVPSVLDSV